MTFTQKIAQRIMELCEEQQLSASKLARKAHMSPNTLYRILKAEEDYDPSLASLFKICHGLGISLHEFFAADIFSK